MGCERAVRGGRLLASWDAACRRCAVRFCATPKLRRLAINAELRGLVQDRLDKRWSPEQISNSLRVEQPDRPNLHLAPEAIYQASYEPLSVLTTSPRATLRTGRMIRRRRRRGTGSSRFVVPMTPIKQRPEAVEEALLR